MKRLFAFAALALPLLPCFAVDTPPPVLKSATVSNNTTTVTFTPAPSIEQYVIRSGTNVAAPFTNDSSAVLSGTTFRATNTGPMKFYSLAAIPMSSNSLLTANILNRLAYGPTPDELQRIAAIGPQAYIDEQLAPEGIAESLDIFTGVVETTNGVPPLAVPEWNFINVTGTVSSSNLYVYLTRGCDAYIDDIELRVLMAVITTNNPTGTNEIYTTNLVAGTNMIWDGDFEAPALAPPWVFGRVGSNPYFTNVAGSASSTAFAHSGSRSLHLVSATDGTTQTNALWQSITNFNFNFNNNSRQCVLSFWYLETTNSSRIKLRLGNSGVNGSGNDVPETPRWIYVTATGRATATPALYVYLDDDGEVYIDDIKLVAGSVPEAGVNLLQNGDFESALTGPWQPTADFIKSYISTEVSHSGAGSLRLIATAGGGGNNDSITQRVSVVNGSTYTVSFWCTAPTAGRILNVRLSGSQLVSTVPQTTAAGLRHSLENLRPTLTDDGVFRIPRVTGGANINDLRAWFTMNAVASKRQLLEILTQFLENHFVTQHSKSLDYLDAFYDDGDLMQVFATDWEYREVSKWRAKLLDPNCNFYDLLRIHAESPAEIVYLDSVNSKGSGTQVANENYAREILELFCMGVDNGYDQQDIIVMSRAWTGWSVDVVDPENANDPHALRTERVGNYSGAGSGAVSNLIGVWAFRFKNGDHGTNRAPIWSVWDPASPATNPQPIRVGGVPQQKTVPARFGPPWAGTGYALTIPPNRTGTNGIQDGYDVLAKIADLPFTMEYISVKLCRLFVHDDFVHGVYDYTDPNRSAEAELVRQCMVAWDTPVNGRKGNIRLVLRTIFDSDLFRTHVGSLQKVKTPLEFVASAVRAVRSTNTTGGFTATTDGYSFNNPLNRMGGMGLFNRAEPDGYPEAGPPWISAGTLDERVLFVQALLRSGTGDDAGNCTTDPVGLLKAKLPSNQWNDAGAVADYFLSIIYPGEGKANLDSYRELAINFLNKGDNGITDSPFLSQPNTQTPYDTRVRGMVAMLMTLQRFQEQ